MVCFPLPRTRVRWRELPLVHQWRQHERPETGYASYGDISGLNDVLRSRKSTVGLNATEFASEIGGATQ